MENSYYVLFYTVPIAHTTQVIRYSGLDQDGVSSGWVLCCI